MKKSLLIIDDDPDTRRLLLWALGERYEVSEAWDEDSTLETLERFNPAVVLLDLHLPPNPEVPDVGLKLIPRIPGAKVIAITGDRERDLALRAVGLGAFDFFSKPIDADVLSVVLERAFYLRELEEENRRMRGELERRYSLDNIVGGSPAMQVGTRRNVPVLFSLIEKVSGSDATVLIEGETGTGKELIARAIHHHSRRKDGPFVVVDCAALSESLLENELFGHERGAFTGAGGRSKGQLAVADGGTLFLVRVIAATNRRLEELVDRGQFRRDLYYRISVVPIFVPPLRERLEDIPLLVDHFIGLYGGEIKRGGIAPSVMDALMRYPWPGNVRESRVRRALVTAEGAITLRDFGLEGEERPPSLALEDVRDDATRKHILFVLRKNGGDISKSARDLRIRRESLYRLMRRFGMDPREHR